MRSWKWCAFAHAWVIVPGSLQGLLVPAVLSVNWRLWAGPHCASPGRRCRLRIGTVGYPQVPAHSDSRPWRPLQGAYPIAQMMEGEGVLVWDIEHMDAMQYD